MANNQHSPTTTTTTSLQDMSAAAAAIALDMKPKTAERENLAQTQKIKKLVRRNASDKLKLIQMVHDNPILWDSRLPNFKGAEEEKNRAWEFIGREFNAPGRRVARAFKSLRESYRRELAHVKLMGNGFKPKWSLYEAMDFLRDVIRERKGGSHAADTLALGLSAFAQHISNNNNSSNNNNNNLNHSNNNNNHSNSKSSLKLAAVLHSTPTTYTDAVLNLSKCATLAQDDFYYFVKPELEHSISGSSIMAGITNTTSNELQPLPAHQATQLHHLQQQQQQQQQQKQKQLLQLQNDSRVSSTRNDNSTQNTTYDDMEISSMHSGDEDANSVNNAHLSQEDASDEIEELEAIDADFPYPLILNSNSPASASNGDSSAGRKRKRKNVDDVDADGASLPDDEYEDQMLQQHRHLRQQQNAAISMDMPPPQTVREVLNSKFCGFISAKLNSMEDSEADNLMNRILMLLVQTQANEAK